MRNPLAITIPQRNGGRALAAMQTEIRHRDRSKLHLTRRMYHLFAGLTCFALYAFWIDRTMALILLGTVGGTFVFADFFRFRFKWLNHLIVGLFGKMMRREELKGFSANSYYVVGLIVVTLVFPKPIALLSVLYLAIGDPIAAIVGTQWGLCRLPFGKKSLEGALANLVVSGFATGLFCHFYLHQNFEFSLLIAAIGGVLSTFVELVPSPVDDNFTIPVLSAILLTLTNYFLPFF